MRRLRSPTFVLLLICCLCVHLHGQNGTSCKAPEPASGQTKDQQDAAASGYMAACKAATASDAHALGTEAKKSEQTKGGAQVDEAIDADVLMLPNDQAAWDVNDYFHWIEQQGCPKLLRQAKKGIVGRTTGSQKTYLALIVRGVTERNKCN